MADDPDAPSAPKKDAAAKDPPDDKGSEGKGSEGGDVDDGGEAKGEANVEDAADSADAADAADSAPDSAEADGDDDDDDDDDDASPHENDDAVGDETADASKKASETKTRGAGAGAAETPRGAKAPRVPASTEPAPSGTTKIAIGVGLLLAAVVIYRCAADPKKVDEHANGASDAATSVEPSTSAGDAPPGLSAPIAAANVGGDVIVVALDQNAKAIRAQRINAKDEIVADRKAFTDVGWTQDSELKVAASPEGVFVTWRGLKNGKLARQLALLSPDLNSKREPIEVAAASCATRDAIWFSDGSRAVSRPFASAGAATGSGAKDIETKVDLPKEKDASLICGAHRAFALLEEEERTSILPLPSSSSWPPPSPSSRAPGSGTSNSGAGVSGDAGAGGSGDAGSGGKGASGASTTPIVVVRENDFGEDEQRELSEYTIGDDVGVVRLASSGALMLREIENGVLGPMHKLKTTIPKDDDVVVVDASPRMVVIVYTQDAGSSCPPPASGGDTVVSTKVTALRVDRQTFEESTIELSPGRCGHEIGPFFTGVRGESVSVAWPERTGGLGKSRAPIVGLAHVLVSPSGSNIALSRIEQSAEAIVDATCDANGCFAAALTRKSDDAKSPGIVKILRYNR